MAEAASSAAPRVRRTQEERSAATRRLLLDATIECLIDLGYTDTTTTMIAERANVSRGAQLHHFPTKAALMSAALEHLAHELGRRFAQQARKIRTEEDPVGEALDALWAGFATPLFTAWLELSVAARTDPDLRTEMTPLEGRLRDAVSDTVITLFGLQDRRADAETALMATVYLFQGMALEQLVGTASQRRRKATIASVIELWKRTLADVIDVG